MTVAATDVATPCSVARHRLIVASLAEADDDARDQHSFEAICARELCGDID